MEIFIPIIILVVLLIINRILCKNHNPFDEISISDLNQLKENGIVHYTNNNNFKKIKEDMYLKAGKPLFKNEKDYVWFYPFNEHDVNIKKLHKKRICDVAIVLYGNNLDKYNFTYREKDNAIVCKGPVNINYAKIIHLNK